MTRPRPTSSMSNSETADPSEEARDLCRTLLQGNPTMPFKEVRESAEGLGLKVSRWMFSSVQKELAGTVASVADATPSTKSGTGESTEKDAGDADDGPRAIPHAAGPAQLKDDKNLKSPVMAFAVHYLREHPDAAFKEVRKAAEAAGHTLYPISYGRAQALLGIVKARPRRSARRQDGDEPKQRSLVQGTPHPSGEVEVFINKANEMSAEVDRYRKALLALRRVLRRALELDD